MENQAGLSSQQPQQPPAPPEPRPKPPSSSVKEVGSGNSAPKPPPPTAAAHARFRCNQPQPTASSSLAPERRGRTPKQVDNRNVSETQNSPFLEVPVRDKTGTGSDRDAGFQRPRPSHPGRKVEPVKPFSVSALSAGDPEEFGHLNPDLSDLTVYNEISQKTREQMKAVSCRGPTPGSEAERQPESCPGPLFSELRQHHRDSGFASPFSLHK